MKKITFAFIIVIVTLLFVSVNPVFADNMQDDNTNKNACHAAYNWKGKLIPYFCGTPRNYKCIATNLRIVICGNFPAMQNLTKCDYTTVGHNVICEDVCGGMSQPFTVCSNE